MITVPFDYFLNLLVAWSLRCQLKKRQSVFNQMSCFIPNPKIFRLLSQRRKEKVKSDNLDSFLSQKYCANQFSKWLALNLFIYCCSFSGKNKYKQSDCTVVIKC